MEIPGNGIIKVIVIGDSMVGKTSFIQRYVNGTFRHDYKSTIGVDFALKTIPWTNPSEIKIQLWDIAGQERFASMSRPYYKDASGCLLMFDLTRKSSFDKVKNWKSDLDSKARLPDGSHIPCLLVGGKSDMQERPVTREDVLAFCKDQGIIGLTETSAKDNVMVHETVSFLLDTIIGNVKSRCRHIRASDDVTESIKLDASHQELLKDKRCSC